MTGETSGKSTEWKASLNGRRLVTFDDDGLMLAEIRNADCLEGTCKLWVPGSFGGPSHLSEWRTPTEAKAGYEKWLDREHPLEAK